MWPGGGHLLHETTMSSIQSTVSVELRDVTYTYPQSTRTALHEINYTFRPGATAIVGPNGAGKSTLVKLLAGLLEPTRGSIDVHVSGGVPVRPIQARKAVLFQEPSHLYLTVRQNVTMRFDPRPGEDARIQEALQAAGLGQVVKDLPDGIDTLVGAGFGGRIDLSGGQWQRLGVARLIYQDAPVMILDEPIASLDPEGERTIFEFFARHMQDRIIIFSTHRYDSIPNDTQVIVLVDGRITETGTHAELLERQQDYWSLGKTARSVAREPAVPQRTDTRRWQITRMSDLERDDLELIDAIRKSRIAITSLDTKNISVRLVHA